MAFVQGPQPLPANTFHVTNNEPFREAYEQCLAMQADANENRMHARCLGFLIRELPRTAAFVVATEVVSCQANFGRMSELCKMYIDHLFRLFRSNKGETPTPSDHPTRSQSVENLRDNIRQNLIAAPTSHAAAKKLALRRDNYRCVVTGHPDKKAYKKMSLQVRDAVFNFPPNGPRRFSHTNFCHIFPPSTNWNLNNHDKARYSGGVWGIIAGFGSIDALNELNGPNIHNIRNGFTMIQDLHTDFDNLDLWFEEIQGQPHSYRVRTGPDESVVLAPFGPNHIVTFTTTDPRLPLPDPRYLKLHAAICRVAHLSGASKYLELKKDQDADMMPVLASEGSSAELLHSRINELVIEA